MDTSHFIKLSNKLYEVDAETGELYEVEYTEQKRIRKFNKECENVIFGSSPFNLMPYHILEKITSYLKVKEDFKIVVPYFKYKNLSHPLCKICEKCVNHTCKCKLLKYCQLCHTKINGRSIYYRFGRAFCKSCGTKEKILVSITQAMRKYFVPETELNKIPFIEIKSNHSGWVTLFERRLVEKLAIPILQLKREKLQQRKEKIKQQKERLKQREYRLNQMEKQLNQKEEQLQLETIKNNFKYKLKTKFVNLRRN